MVVSCDTLTKTAENAFNRYKITSPSMAPTLPVGMTFSVLSTDTIKVNQIIVYTPPTKNVRGIDSSAYWVCRVVGVPGDKLQMKMGQLIRNDEPYQFAIPLKHSYRVTTTMPLNEKRMEEFEYGPSGADEYLFHLSDSELPKVNKNKAIEKIESMILNPDEAGTDGNIFVGGNRDNWGPITIEKESYFVLGDNRHNALDSRYLGFIPARNIKGFVAGD